ncbi:MAG: DUF1553 domain-containing protein [Gemmataceae bacterium]
MRAFLLPGLLLSALVPSFGRAADVDFNRDVRPILADKCYHCHGPDVGTRKAGLRLDTAKGAARVLRGGAADKTEFYQRLVSTDPDERMPPAESNIAKQLTAKEVATLKAWIDGGAKYVKHWAYEPPAQVPLPAVGDPAWRAPIDRFVLARLAREGFKPAPRADRRTLLRRVTLDLTGLPPTPAEVQAFVDDPRPDAYDKVVDRLLKSPRFGERMAVAWMDLARYGDSSVYHADGPRDMWGWRDGVIRAFNDNQPYDRFTVEQLAGDLLPGATLDQKVASGFNRNHATTDEGGVIPEEFRVDYVVDRVKTVSNTWLAISMECAQCHDHKYDPVTMKEYYSFYAYFNNTKDAGMQTRNGNSAPLVEVPDPEAEAKQKLARQALDEAAAKVRRHRETAGKGKAFAAWLAKQAAPAGVSPLAVAPAFYLPLDDSGPRLNYLATLDGKVGGYVAGKPAAAKRPGGAGMKLAGAVVEFADNAPFDANRPFTFAAWVKLPANGGGPLLTRMEEDPTYAGFDIGFEGMRPGLHLVHRWSDDALKVYAKAPLKPDTWQHVVIRYDGSKKAAGIAIFVDGVRQENAVSVDNLKGTVGGQTALRLGSRTSGPAFNGDVDALAVYPFAAAGDEIKHLARDPIARALAGRTPAQLDVLVSQFLRTSDKAYQNLLRTFAGKVTGERVARRATTSVMVMEDLPPAQMRPTYVLNRGQYDQPRKDQRVTPGVPSILSPLPADAPANRLGLARWLVQPDHPLTGRVAVNRLWQLFFGEGLVRTSEDFGLQGEVPSHPELLDWLAVDFVKSGWDVKRMIRQIVTSETYCQDARATPSLRERDPENRLLGRGARTRLQAEFLRDQALFVSGLLVEKVGGPSVKPYQPAGVWEEVALDTGLSRYVQDRGEKLFRRSLYTYWKRSAPPPSMMTFDAPTREKCSARRPRTNTPLQALVTLNDPQYVEAARAFAQRILKEGGSTPEQRIDFAFRTALGRPATAKELSLLTRLLTAQLARFRAAPAKAEELLKVGESPRDATLPAVEHAAWQVIASTVLNLDEFLVKN